MLSLKTSNLRYDNNYFRNRSQGIRFKLEQNFLNKLQYYIYDDVMPILKNFANIRALNNNPEYFNGRINAMKLLFSKKIEELAKKHFRDILKLSLTKKYGAWHKVPPHEVSKMLNLLWKQSKFAEKSKYFANSLFQQSKPLFKQSAKQFQSEGSQIIVDAVSDLFVKGMGSMSRTVYTHSTYFMNSAYEIQFRARDPQDNFRYIWGTRPDNRRTIQCQTIEELVTKEMKEEKEEGVTLDKLEEIVNKVANMEGFKKANPNIKWTPHYGCRSGIERIV